MTDILDEDGIGVDGIGTALVAGKRFAVGLNWNTAETSVTLKKEAREQAARDGAELVCIRKSQVAPQYGLGFKQTGQKAGMPSLAASLAQGVEDTFLGVYLTDDDLYYLFVYADENIVSEEAFADEEAARARFDDFLYQASGGSWDTLVCPADWNVSGSAEPDDLGVVITGRSRIRLRDVSPFSSRNLLVGTAILVVVVGGGYFGYEQFVAEPEIPPGLAQLRQPPPQKVVPPPMPWIGKALPVAYVKACIGEVDARIKEVPGWRITTVKCQGNQVTARLTKEGGSINWVRPALATTSFSPKVTSSPMNTKTAIVTWSLPKLVAYPKEAPDTDLNKAKGYLLSQFDEIFEDIRLKKGDSEPFWRGLKYSYQTASSPLPQMGIIGKIPANVISSLEYAYDSGVWKVEGQIYEKHKPTPQELKRYKATHRR